MASSLSFTCSYNLAIVCSLSYLIEASTYSFVSVEIGLSTSEVLSTLSNPISDLVKFGLVVTL
jgi:hypothetical protein